MSLGEANTCQPASRGGGPEPGPLPLGSPGNNLLSQQLASLPLLCSGWRASPRVMAPCPIGEEGFISHAQIRKFVKKGELSEKAVQGSSMLPALLYCFAPLGAALSAGGAECEHFLALAQCIHGGGGTVTKYHKLAYVKERKSILSQLWRPEVQNQGVRRLESFWRL